MEPSHTIGSGALSWQNQQVMLMRCNIVIWIFVLRRCWIDLLKGLGIILVVVGHGLRGIEQAQVPLDPTIFAFIDRTIYSFHMPLFFFVSGLFFQKIVSREQLLSFVQMRVLTLVWPLAVWTWIFYGFKIAAGEYQNSPIAIADFPIMPLPPTLHFWFLWALFLIQLVAGVLFIVGRKANLTTFMPFIILAVVVIIQMIPVIEQEKAQLFLPAIRHAPFFVFGLLVAGYTSAQVSRSVGSVGLLGALLLAGTVGIGALPGNTVILPSLIVAGLSVFFIAFEKVIMRSVTGRLVTLAGAASMSIYVMHTLFSSAVREVLLAIGVDQIVILMALVTAAGVFLPMLVDLILLSGTKRQFLGLQPKSLVATHRNYLPDFIAVLQSRSRSK